jgi:transketolase
VIAAHINPAPVEELAGLLAQHSVVLTVEAHYRVGGLGSLVAEVIAERQAGCRLVRCGVDSLPKGISGSRRYLHHLHGLSSERVVETAIAALRKTMP